MVLFGLFCSGKASRARQGLGCERTQPDAGRIHTTMTTGDELGGKAAQAEAEAEAEAAGKSERPGVERSTSLQA